MRYGIPSYRYPREKLDEEIASILSLGIEAHTGVKIGVDITFEELGTALFGVYRESDRRSVMVNVSRLRKRFEGNYELENRIETVWSKGYRFLKGGI